MPLFGRLGIILGWTAIATSACTTTVTRWTMEGPEKGDRSLDVTRQTNIFQDFLWSTPDIKSRRLKFTDNQASVSFAGENYMFALNADGRMGLTTPQARTAVLVQPQVSEHSLYHDLASLTTHLVPRQRQVLRTRTVTKMETVSRTRPVTRTVPVVRSRMVSSGYGATASSHMETYTEYETRMEHETYLTSEPRTSLETYYDWQTVQEPVVDVPNYTYYAFTTPTGAQIVIYKIQNADRFDYYLQNTSYLSAFEQ